MPTRPPPSAYQGRSRRALVAAPSSWACPPPTCRRRRWRRSWRACPPASTLGALGERCNIALPACMLPMLSPPSACPHARHASAHAPTGSTSRAAAAAAAAAAASYRCRWAQLDAEGDSSWSQADRGVHKMVMNVGRRPTFEDGGEPELRCASGCWWWCWCGGGACGGGMWGGGWRCRGMNMLKNVGMSSSPSPFRGLRGLPRRLPRSVEAHIMHPYSQDFYGQPLRLLALGYIRWVGVWVGGHGGGVGRWERWSGGGAHVQDPPVRSPFHRPAAGRR